MNKKYNIKYLHLIPTTLYGQVSQVEKYAIYL